MRWRSTHNRARQPRRQCARNGHISEFGYGFAFGGGLGGYEFCRRCNILIHKEPDNDDCD